MLDAFASVRKALVSALGVTVTVLTAYHELSFLPAQPLVTVVLGVLTVVATYLVPNK